MWGARALKYPRPRAPDPLDPATAALWMQLLCANARLCTNAGCLVRSFPVLGASARDLGTFVAGVLPKCGGRPGP